jgi:uncharacterized protein YdcH (DUF465 family)
MSENLDALKDSLRKDNDEYRRLDQQHHEYESRLETLTAKAVLNEEEHFEASTLKKKKLQAKDRMQLIARHARESALSH